MSAIKQFLEYTYKVYLHSHNYIVRPRIECMDGFSFSAQASWYHYCDPKETLYPCDYRTVEVGYPNKMEPLLMRYAENNDWCMCPKDGTVCCKRTEKEIISTVYPHVPINLVDIIIKKHGGYKTMFSEVLKVTDESKEWKPNEEIND